MIPTRDIADNFFAKGNYRTALQIYLDILQQEPTNAQLYQSLAQCYYRLKKYESATAASVKALELNSTLSIPHTVLAYVYYYQNKNLGKALAEALEAYDTSPISEDAINCYGALLLASGKLNESKSILMRGLEINSRSVPIHYNLAVAYNKEHDHKKSLAEFKAVFNLKPTLRHGLQLLLFYEQRYAFPVSFIVVMTLFGALLLQAKVLLLIPLVMTIQGWIMIFNFVKESRWKEVIVFLLGNSLFSLLIYWFYTAVG